MEDQKTQPPRPRLVGVFVPSLLLAIALLVMTGFQTIQLNRERDLMKTRNTQQEKPLKESRTVRKQWDAIRAGTIELARRATKTQNVLSNGCSRPARCGSKPKKTPDSQPPVQKNRAES